MELLKRLAGQYLKAKKKDNAHVEQKGGDKVRKLIGYWRDSEKEELRSLMRNLNMVKLKKEMDELIKTLIAMKISTGKGKNSKKHFTDNIYDLTRVEI